MIPPVEAAEICVAVPVAICLVAPLGCLVGALFLGGLAMAPVACILLPLACCLPCTLCCCPQALPNAGDETGAGLYTDRPVFFTPYGTAVYTRGGLYDDGEILIVNSTVFQTAGASEPALGGGGGGGATRRGGVVITELPPDEDGAAGGKPKAA